MHSLSWGNAYTETNTTCPSPTPGTFNGSVAKCWSTRCVRDAAPDVFQDCFDEETFPSRVTAQHGKEEDTSNVIETCAAYVSRNSDDSLSRSGLEFIQCFLAGFSGKKEGEKMCSWLAGINYSDLKNCLESGKGYQLEREAAIRTNDFGPHPGVPYVIIDGKPLPDGESLVKAICDRIQGVKPAGCNSTNFANYVRTWSSNC